MFHCLFFQGKASHINEKIVCMVEYIQLTTVFSFAVRQSKVLLYCLSLCIFLVIPVLPCSPPAHHEEEESPGPVRNHITDDCVGLACSRLVRLRSMYTPQPGTLLTFSHSQPAGRGRGNEPK